MYSVSDAVWSKHSGGLVWRGDMPEHYSWREREIWWDHTHTRHWCNCNQRSHPIPCCLPGYTLDPHTAVAWAVSEKVRDGTSKVPLLISSTAHFAKFSSDVLHAVTGRASDLPLASLTQELHRTTSTPSMHQALNRCLFSDVKENNVLSADRNTIQNVIQSIFWRLINVLHTVGVNGIRNKSTNTHI